VGQRCRKAQLAVDDANHAFEVWRLVGLGLDRIAPNLLTFVPPLIRFTPDLLTYSVRVRCLDF
jgi:hypothetical protein